MYRMQSGRSNQYANAPVGMHIVGLHAARPGKWHVTSQMMINSWCFRGGKKIVPWPKKRKRKRLGKCTDARCGPSVHIILHLNIESPSVQKICIVILLAIRFKTHVILLQETRCTNGYQLVTTRFAQDGLVSSRKHGLATLVHKKLSWALTNRSPEGSAMEWWCVDADGCKIFNICNLQPRD